MQTRFCLALPARSTERQLSTRFSHHCLPPAVMSGAGIHSTEPRSNTVRRQAIRCLYTDRSRWKVNTNHFIWSPSNKLYYTVSDRRMSFRAGAGIRQGATCYTALDETVQGVASIRSRRGGTNYYSLKQTARETNANLNLTATLMNTIPPSLLRLASFTQL